MKKSRILLVLPAFVLLFFIIDTLGAAPARDESTGVFYATLSDHGMTEGDLLQFSQPSEAATSHQLLAVWGEETGNDEYARFFAAFPGGATQQLPGDSLPWMSGFFAPGTAGSERGCFFWDDQFFCSDYAAPVNVPQPLTQIVLDEAGMAHGLAVVPQPPHPWQEELYYWSEATGQATLLSNPAAPESIITQPRMRIYGGEAHVVWTEFDAGGKFAPFYWDSSSGQVRALAQADNTYATGARLLPDGAGVMHVLWLSESTSTGEDRCPMHWDSASGVTTNLLGDPAACAASGISTAGSESGAIHAAWQNDPGWGEEGMYYWNSTMVSATLVTEDGTLSYGFSHRLFAGGGKVHLVYTQEGIWRHWEATEQISRILGADSSEHRYAMNDSGVLHAGWLENRGSLNEPEWHVYYWDSTVLTKTLVSDDPQLLGGRVHEFEVGPGDSGQGAALWIQQRADSDDQVLVRWDGGGGGPEIVDGLDSYIYGRLGFDDSGLGFATYPAAAPGGGHSDIYFWRESSGAITNLSAGSGAGAGDVVNFYGGDTFLLPNDSVLVLWMEESGGSEGSDLLAAWFVPSLPEKVFLPAVLR